MPLKANFTDVGTFEPIPAGVYEIELSEVEVKQSETSEYEYIACTLKITEGEYLNRNLWTNLSLSPKAAWKLKEALLAFGIDESELEGEIEFEPEDYIGARCKASVTQTSYEGRLQNSVVSLHALDEAVSAPSSASSGAKKVSRPKIR